MLGINFMCLSAIQFFNTRQERQLFNTTAFIQYSCLELACPDQLLHLLTAHLVVMFSWLIILMEPLSMPSQSSSGQTEIQFKTLPSTFVTRGPIYDVPNQDNSESDNSQEDTYMSAQVEARKALMTHLKSPAQLMTVNLQLEYQ